MDYTALTMLLVAMISAIAAAVVSIINAIRTPQIVAEKVSGVEQKIQELHIIVNDRLTQLLYKTEEGALATGRAAGMAEQAAANQAEIDKGNATADRLRAEISEGRRERESPFRGSPSRPPS